MCCPPSCSARGRDEGPGKGSLLVAGLRNNDNWHNNWQSVTNNQTCSKYKDQDPSPHPPPAWSPPGPGQGGWSRRWPSSAPARWRVWRQLCRAPRSHPHPGYLVGCTALCQTFWGGQGRGMALCQRGMDQDQLEFLCQKNILLLGPWWSLNLEWMWQCTKSTTPSSSTLGEIR